MEQDIGLAIFLAAFVGDWMTYVTAATELGMAFPVPTFASAWVKMMIIYSYTQIPISIAESFLTVIIFDYIRKTRSDLLVTLNVIKPEDAEQLEEVPVQKARGELSMGLWDKKHIGYAVIICVLSSISPTI